MPCIPAASRWCSWSATTITGVVAISLDGEDEARVYGWTYGINFRPHRLGEESLGPRLFDADFTDHTVTYLQRGADGHWRLTWHGSALDAELIGEEVGRGDVLLGGLNEVFLPYYALNASARRALAVREFEEYWLDRDESPPADRPAVVRPGADSPPPTPAARPAPAPEPAATPASSGSVGELSPEESPLVARIGRRLGSNVPRLIAPEGDARFSWRFSEQPLEWLPDRPWLLHRGEPVAAPEPWMLDAATLVLTTVAGYHEAVFGDAAMVLPRVPLPDALAALLTGSELRSERSRRELPDSTIQWTRQFPYDYGIVSINLDGEDEARVYGWTHGSNSLVQHVDEESPRLLYEWPFTDHTVTHLRREADGYWRITRHVSALDAELIGEDVGRGDAMLSGDDSVFLPYYELNSNARRALGVAEFEEYWLEAGEE